jgi:thioredoxin reductase (NADPH)
MDIAIIGAGPVGLFAAFQAGLLGMKACVIDALDFAGGQCAALYPDKPIYDIPAHPSILASDLVANLEKQAKHFKPEFHLGAQITNLERKPDQEGFVLHTSNGRTIKTKTVLIAAGSGLFTPNKPKLEGLEKHEDKSIFYSVRDKSHFKDKKVIIFGGGDSALDWCIEFVDFASHVTLVHRRDKFSCLDSSLEKA